MKNKPKKQLTYWEKHRASFFTDYGDDNERSETFAKQFDERGWANDELWSLDFQFVRWFVPRLEELIKYKYPEIKKNFKFESEEDKKNYLETRQMYLDMLEGFKGVYEEKDYFSCDWGFSKNAPKEVKVRYKKVIKSLKLFPKLFYGMWI